MTATSTTRAMVLLGAAFLIGAVAGGAVIKYSAKPGERHDRRGDCAVRHQRVCMWAGELQLSTDQQERLEAIYRTGEATMDSIQRTIRPAMDTIFQRIRPAVDAQRQAIREQVRPLLTPEQRAKYDSVNTAVDENRRRERDRSPNGPGMPGGPSRGRP
jgi:Spy/CpxP family protein refolding chaperone